MPTFVLPERYSLVLAAAVSTLYLNTFQLMKVGRARKRAGIIYPQMYAEKAEAEASKDALIFNCLQRAHGNTLEFTSHVILGTLVTGLWWPELAAGLGFAWTAARVMFTLNYGKGDPDKKNSKGAIIHALSYLGLVTSSTYATYYLFVSGH